MKLDAGKYLAGDFGSTISMSRTFNNGWELGAYATLTDVPFSTYGEGSFEKGLTIKAPINWFTGKKSKSVMNAIDTANYRRWRAEAEFEWRKIPL